MLIANLLAQIAFGLMAMTISLPSMQEWGAIFGAGQSEVQLTFSAFMVAFGVMQLVYGPLSDRYGRKLILLTGLSLAGLGSLLCALAPGIESLVGARIVQGAGSAAGMVVGRSLVQDLFHGSERTRLMAYIGMVMGLCPPLATIIGGQIHVRLGWQANFLLMAAISVVLAVAAWRGLPARRIALTGKIYRLRDMLAAYARLAREPQFPLYIVVLSMTTATFYVFLGGAPLVLGGYGVGPQGIGWYVMFVPLSYIAGNFLTSQLIQRTGERRMMVLGQLASLAGIGLMLALGVAGLKTPLAFALPLILLGFGHGFLVPPTLAGSVGLVPALAGSAAAVAGFTQQMMGAVGSYSVGLVSHQGSVNLGLLMLGFMLLATFAQIALLRR